MKRETLRVLFQITRFGYKLIALLSIVLVCVLMQALDADPILRVSAHYATAPVTEEVTVIETEFPLTAAEYRLVCEVVEAEAGGEIYCGQVAVAQCIRNACELDGLSPAEAIEEYDYTTSRKEPSESVCEAVTAVFTWDEVAIDADIKWFYAPARVTSGWHETLEFEGEIGGHRFFSARED